MAGFDGIAKFTAALAGRDRIRQAAEDNAYKGLKQRAEGEIAADEFRSRIGLADSLIAAGVDSNDANTLSSVYRAGAGNFQQGTAGLQNLFDLATGRTVQQIAQEENPDLRKVNILLAGRTSGGGPLTPQEGAVVPLGDAMVQSELAQAEQRNALGNAALMRAGAAAGASNASAAASQARADLYGRTNPNLRSVRSGSTLQSGPEMPLGDALGTVADLGPEDETFVVTEDTGPQGVPLQNVEKFTQTRTNALQALDDARRAIATGKISKEAAKKRLIDAGFKNVAGRL